MANIIINNNVGVYGKYNSTFPQGTYISIEYVTSTEAKVTLHNPDKKNIYSILLINGDRGYSLVDQNILNTNAEEIIIPYYNLNANEKYIVLCNFQYVSDFNITPMLDVDYYSFLEFKTLPFQDNVNALCSNSFEKYINSSLHKYYKLLTYEGYVKTNETFKLLALDMINEILSGELSHCLKKEDLKYIELFLNKIYGSNCLFPYPTCCINGGSTSSTDDENITCEDILDPIKTSYWKDSEYWRDHKLWKDEGCTD